MNLSCEYVQSLTAECQRDFNAERMVLLVACGGGAFDGLVVGLVVDVSSRPYRAVPHARDYLMANALELLIRELGGVEHDRVVPVLPPGIGANS